MVGFKYANNNDKLHEMIFYNEPLSLRYPVKNHSLISILQGIVNYSLINVCCIITLVTLL